MTYKCPTCGSHDPFQYVECQRVMCPDGNDQRKAEDQECPEYCQGVFPIWLFGLIILFWALGFGLAFHGLVYFLGDF